MKKIVADRSNNKERENAKLLRRKRKTMIWTISTTWLQTHIRIPNNNEK